MLFLYSEATALRENKQFNNKIFNFFKKKDLHGLKLPLVFEKIFIMDVSEK